MYPPKKKADVFAKRNLQTTDSNTDPQIPADIITMYPPKKKADVFAKRNLQTTDSNTDPSPATNAIFRYVPYHDVTNFTALEILGYTEDTWNYPGTAEIETISFTDLSVDQTGAAVSLGFTEDTWNCYQNHYTGYEWSDLKDYGFQVYWEELGYDQESWNGLTDPPEVYYLTWAELNESQKNAAGKVCYFEQTWNMLDLNDWAWEADDPPIKPINTDPTPPVPPTPPAPPSDTEIPTDSTAVAAGVGHGRRKKTRGSESKGKKGGGEGGGGKKGGKITPADFSCCEVNGYQELCVRNGSGPPQCEYICTRPIPCFGGHSKSKSKRKRSGKFGEMGENSEQGDVRYIGPYVTRPEIVSDDEYNSYQERPFTYTSPGSEASTAENEDENDYEIAVEEQQETREIVYSRPCWSAANCSAWSW